MPTRRPWIEIDDKIDDAPNAGGWTLSFQKVTHHYKEIESERGFRFMYYRPDGKLATSRGQARLPSLATVQQMLDIAKVRDGWPDWIGPA